MNTEQKNEQIGLLKKLLQLVQHINFEFGKIKQSNTKSVHSLFNYNLQQKFSKSFIICINQVSQRTEKTCDIWLITWEEHSTTVKSQKRKFYDSHKTCYL